MVASSCETHDIIESGGQNYKIKIAKLADARMNRCGPFRVVIFLLRRDVMSNFTFDFKQKLFK